MYWNCKKTVPSVVLGQTLSTDWITLPSALFYWVFASHDTRYTLEKLYRVSIPCGTRYTLEQLYRVFFVPSVYTLVTRYSLYRVFCTECCHSGELAVTVRPSDGVKWVPSANLYRVFIKHSIQIICTECFYCTECIMKTVPSLGVPSVLYRVSHSVKFVPSVFRLYRVFFGTR